MAACIDLRKAHLTRQHGDLIAVYTWINHERALVLMPARRRSDSWYVVMESAAYKYDDPAYMARQCATACEVLGMSPIKSNWVRVATIINEGLPDLVMMPGEPDWSRPRTNVGEMTMLADGDVIARDVIAIEGEGAEYAPA